MSFKPMIIGAVEIGTSKIAVLVGEISHGRRLRIIGRGESASQGVVKGEVMDFKAASDRVHRALLDAERSAETRINQVYLAQSGGHLKGSYHEEAVSVRSADNLVSAMDIDTVWQLATSKELPADRYIVQQMRRPFRLDGRTVANPEFLNGSKLEVGCWTVHGHQGKIADQMNIIVGFALPVKELILSSLASARMVTTPEDRRLGVLAIDLGCGTTDFVLYRDGLVHLTGVLPVAGDHLTNDLSIGLRNLSRTEAEKLKLRHGCGVVRTRDRNEKVWLNGDYKIGDRQFSKLAIEQITAARTQEIMEVVHKALGPKFEPEKVAAGVVLTGGTAKLPGVDEAAAKVFGLTARLGEAPPEMGVRDDLRDPGYSTVLGLLNYGLNAGEEQQPIVRKPRGFFQKFNDIFSNT